METIKVFLADDHEIFRNGLRSLIAQEPDMEVVGEAANGEEVVQKAEAVRPDVIIMDIRMPRLNGVEAARLLMAKNPNLRILIFSLYDNVEYVTQALALGAMGYLLKDTSNKIFLDAIRKVHKNEFYYIGEVSHSVIQYLRTHGRLQAESSAPAAARENLSKKEREIISLVRQGKNSKEIADLLGNSVRTIDAHRHNIIAKFSARNMEEVLGHLDSEQ
ncbi:response regulator transcription factor [Paraflavisolibacter sp. H34]|uniref:response regulator transcription factor n=1 Tax=Huijunlia imazamoxiresistens TaxID=3127457 RepID=UPI0030184254